MRSLILSVIFMLSLTNSALAYRDYDWTGWDTNAWPSYKAGKVRWNSTNVIVNMTNVWVWKVVQTQIINISAGSLPNYNTNGYTYDPVTFASPIFGSMYIPANTSSNAYTNVLYGIYFTRYGTNVTETISPQSDAESVVGDGWILNESYTNYFVEKYATNMLLNASDIRAVDTFKCINYLADLNLSPSTNRLAILWRDERNTIHSIKSNLKKKFVASSDYYLVALATTQAIALANYELSAGEYYNATNFIIREYTNDYDFCLSHSLPSNYFRYTPQRNLAGATVGWPRVLTNTYTIKTPLSTVVTQTCTDYIGTSHTVSGTNGQNFSFIVTNQNVATGFTTADYGWKYIPIVYSNLSKTVQEVGQNFYYALDADTDHAYVGVGTGATVSEAYQEASNNFAITSVYSLDERTIGNVGTVYTYPYGNNVGAHTRIKKYSNNETTLTRLYADGLVWWPNFTSLSNKPANYRIVYQFGKITNSTTIIGGLYTYHLRTTNSCYTFNVTRPTKQVYTGTLPTNVLFTGFGLDKNAVYSKNSALFPTATTPLPINSTGIGITEGGYDGWGYPTNDFSLDARFRIYVIFDWQHPWINVITN